MNGLTCIPNDVLQTIRNYRHWELTDQLLHVCKPLVDAIGNLESRNATLADCELELLRCAKYMFQLEWNEADDTDFTYHAKSTFNRLFHVMNTAYHWFGLFLHPRCHQLAISQALKSRTLTDAQSIALKIAHKWEWGRKDAELLKNHIRDYYHACKPFQGSHKDAHQWWNDVTEESPLKEMALIIHGLVPHSAEVEHLFSNLGGIQGTQRSRLTIPTFEALARMKSHYNNILHDHASAEGKHLRCTHAHMHTREDGSINEATA